MPIRKNLAKVLILGGGLSGELAIYLNSPGKDAEIVEAAERTGTNTCHPLQSWNS